MGIPFQSVGKSAGYWLSDASYASSVAKRIESRKVFIRSYKRQVSLSGEPASAPSLVHRVHDRAADTHKGFGSLDQ